MKPKIFIWPFTKKKSFLTIPLEKKDTVSKYTHTRYIQVYVATTHILYHVTKVKFWSKSS